MAVDEKGYHLEDYTLEAAICVHVSHSAWKMSLPPFHSTQEGKVQTEEGKREARGMVGKARGQ